MDTIYYRRKLPHIHPQNNPLFITFSLVDSLPATVVAELKAQREKELQAAKSAEERYSIQKKYFGYYDEWLDRCEYGHDWLKQETIAQIVADEIHQASSRHYELYAYCIMSNHVHLLILSLIEKFPPSKGVSAVSPVAEIMRLLKGRTARFCNLALNRAGKFWHHEYYDHYVRDEKEMERIIWYILNNPVKAGLVNEWKYWKFAYVNPEFGEW
ncbi:MAG: transposase [Chloroflexi bacterium]|nr:transposase [Chloroflexota bacterium]